MHYHKIILICQLQSQFRQLLLYKGVTTIFTPESTITPITILTIIDLFSVLEKTSLFYYCPLCPKAKWSYLILFTTLYQTENYKLWLS